MKCVEVILRNDAVEEFINALHCKLTNSRFPSVQTRVALDRPPSGRYGQISVQEIMERDADMSQAVEKRLLWKVLQW